MKSAKNKDKNEKIFVWTANEKTLSNVPFSNSNQTTLSSEDSLIIPTIPDIDDINEVAFEIENLKISTNATKENFTELNQEDNFNLLDDIDLSILTKYLQPTSDLVEPDVVWNWNQKFAEISNKINSENAKK